MVKANYKTSADFTADRIIGEDTGHFGRVTVISAEVPSTIWIPSSME